MKTIKSKDIIKSFRKPIAKPTKVIDKTKTRSEDIKEALENEWLTEEEDENDLF